MPALSKAFEKRVRQLRQKKFRDKQSLFIAEGDKLILQLIDSGVQLKEFVWTEDSLGLQGEKIELKELKQISTLNEPTNSLAIFEKKELASNIDQPLLLFLEEIQDPGNLGAILRTAAWFGHNVIYTSPSCADPFSPKAIQSSMGAIGLIDIRRMPLSECVEVWRSDERKILAADMNGIDFKEWDAKSKAAVIIGNEGRGLSDEALSVAENLIRIPGGGEMESLNAAISASILMSHWF